MSPNPPFDPALVRLEFPALHQSVHGKPLVYLDSAATSQKPLCVIEALRRHYALDNANIHRGLHALAERSTAGYDAARVSSGRYLGLQDADSQRGIVFVRGATEGINLVAASWGRAHLQPGDRVLLSHSEHHANIVPWQMICAERGAHVDVLPLSPSGEWDLSALPDLLGRGPKMVAVAAVSNALGTVNPVAHVVAEAKRAGALTLVDACQAAPHGPLDIPAMGCDFLVFSGHKVFGPTGIGILWGRPELLDAMPPYQGGGDMIDQVRFSGSTFLASPQRFEAGTPHIAGAIGLGVALEWAMGQDWVAIGRHEAALLSRATERLLAIPGVRIIGTAAHKAPVLSFTVAGVSPYDLAEPLDHAGVAIRTGHHCAMPTMAYFDVPATARASFALYNTFDEVDVLGDALEKSLHFFR